MFSSPEPSGSQGELIVYPCSGKHFQRSSPLKPLGQSKSIFLWRLLGKGNKSLGHMTKIAAMPVKALKNLCTDLETWYEAAMTGILQNLYK